MNAAVDMVLNAVGAVSGVAGTAVVSDLDDDPIIQGDDRMDLDMDARDDLMGECPSCSTWCSSPLKC